MERKRRERLDILKDILNVTLIYGKISPTKLLVKSNLSPQMFKDYVKFLEYKDLIKFIESTNKKSRGRLNRFGGHRLVTITERGRQYLEEYRKIDTILNGYDLKER